MTKEGNQLSDSFVKILSNMARDYMRGLLRNKEEGFFQQRRSQNRNNIVAVLLEDLTNVGTSPATVLSLEPTSEVQYVRLIGRIVGGSFTLSFKKDKKKTTSPEITSPIQWDASDEDVRKALYSLPSLNPSDILVEKLPGTWIISFGGNYREVDLPLMTAYGTQLRKTLGIPGDIKVVGESWFDTGEIVDVRMPIPVGSPTPAVKGAMVICVPIPGAGYNVVALECRQLDLGYGVS